MSRLFRFCFGGIRHWRKITLLAVLTGGGVWLAIPDYQGDLNDYRAVNCIYDRHGRMLRMQLGANDTLCEPVALEQTGEWSEKALIAFEDKRFYRHGGIDMIAICRAMLGNAARFRIRSGASTITTLVVKMTEPRRRNLWTKLVEAHHARQLEKQFTKPEIMEQFINRAPFGGNIYGIESASRRYFGKPAQNLSLAESAMLMGLPQSPNTLRPDRHFGAALQRRNAVLWRMYKNGFISDTQYWAARRQEVELRCQPLPFYAPHFCDYIQQHYPGGGTRRTTLDLEMQQMASEVLEARVAAFSPGAVRGGAVVVIDVASGELRAMVGSPDFQQSQVNGAVARRSPGSTLKPFAYAAAIEQGMLTPASMLADVPTSFSGYTPQNYSQEYSGMATVRRALVQSLNIPALRCVDQIGVAEFVQQLRELGISTLDAPAGRYGLGIAVGGCEARLLDLSNAYACLARRGEYVPLRFFEEEAPVAARRIYAAETAFMMADILGGEERSAELIGHMADVYLPRIAWKTGTSSGNRDAWAIAYNPEYVVGVWVGNPDGTPAAELVGGSAAAPVAGEIFRRLYPGGCSPWFDKPEGLKTRSVCAESGLIPGLHCPADTVDYYIPRIAQSCCCTVHSGNGERWPDEVQSFFEQRGMAVRTADECSLCIKSPSDGETFRLLPKQSGVRQEIRLIASATENIYWFVDGKFQPSGIWALEKGEHTIVCADACGRGDAVEIVVH